MLSFSHVKMRRLALHANLDLSASKQPLGTIFGTAFLQD